MLQILVPYDDKQDVGEGRETSFPNRDSHQRPVSRIYEETNSSSEENRPIISPKVVVDSNTPAKQNASSGEKTSNLRILKRPPSVVNVYSYNFEEHMYSLKENLVHYTCISLDTEFPGFIYDQSNSSGTAYERTKLNVDIMQLIQVGISLSTPSGDRCSTVYQFNLKWNIDIANYSAPSVQMLASAGLDFAGCAQQGIAHSDFSQALQWLGILHNPFYTFVAFDGKYDFAYLVSLFSSDQYGKKPLPDTVEEFMKYVTYYFPCILDLKVIAASLFRFNGGLRALDNALGNASLRLYHQGGYDALVTTNCFHAMLKRGGSSSSWSQFNCKINGISLK